MRLVKALMGGVIGGAISVAIMVGAGVYYFLETPSWMALVAGVVTGLGVRMMGKSDKPGPCYACGAIAALLMLAAFFGGTQATAKFVQESVETKQENLPKIDSAVKPKPDQSEEVSPAEEEPAKETPAEEDNSATESEPPAETPAADEAPAESDPPADAESNEEKPAAETGDEAAEDETPAEVEVVEELTEVVEPAVAIPVVKMERPEPAKEDFSISLFVFIVLGALVAYELGRSCGCSKAAA